MLESLKREALNHRASVSVSADLCHFAENYTIPRLIDSLGNFTQKLVSGLHTYCGCPATDCQSAANLLDSYAVTVSFGLGKTHGN